MATPSWVDPQTAHNPAAGVSIPYSWGDQVRDDLVFSRTGPGAKVKMTSTQTGVAASTFTAVTWHSSTRDTDTMWSGGSPTRITSKFSGWYHCVGYGNFTTSNGAKHQLSFRTGGSTYWASNDYVGTIGPYMNCTDLIYLAVNDYVEMMLWHNHSSALIFAANSTMSVTWAGA